MIRLLLDRHDYSFPQRGGMFLGKKIDRVDVWDPHRPKDQVLGFEGKTILLLTGGASDVHPSAWGGEEKEANYYEPDRDLDVFHMIDAGLDYDLDIFGICRGLQAMWVHPTLTGGRLNTHVSHSSYHRVVVPNSLEVSSFAVNSCHHNGCDANHMPDHMSFPLLATTPEDNLIEGAVWNTPPGQTIAGVQWHPEWDRCPADGVALAATMFNYGVN